MWRSILAGIFAATGASSIKLATSGYFDQILTFILYGLFVLANVLMWYIQLDGMANSKTTVTPIIAFTASNFIASGVYGVFLHGETHEAPWFLGLILLLIGVFVVQSSVATKVKAT
ncbi:hypothetical protein M3Y97_00562700 [Aphelenchoides bicaudatus]|nr:hypothetical protein M3Y97_00562700 [Aphelenchoides bicaudatus]